MKMRPLKKLIVFTAAFLLLLGFGLSVTKTSTFFHGTYDYVTANNPNGEVKVGYVISDSDPLMSLTFGLTGRNTDHVVFPEGEPSKGDYVYITAVYYFSLLFPENGITVFTVSPAQAP